MELSLRPLTGPLHKGQGDLTIQAAGNRLDHLLAGKGLGITATLDFQLSGRHGAGDVHGQKQLDVHRRIFLGTHQAVAKCHGKRGKQAE
jgi:hypothetical protein